jgi:steroid delta-isomerase-like uncharacterized protein
MNRGPYTTLRVHPPRGHLDRLLIREDHLAVGNVPRGREQPRVIPWRGITKIAIPGLLVAPAQRYLTHALYDALCALGMLLTFRTTGEEDTMADVIELARQYDEAFNTQDAETRMSIESSDIEVIMPGGMTLRGHEQVMQVVRAFWGALPDGKIVPENQFAAGETVVAEGTLSGTHDGTFRTPGGDIPASGNNVALRYATVKRFQDAKLVSEHLYFDQLEFLQQIGAMPS